MKLFDTPGADKAYSQWQDPKDIYGNDNVPEEIPCATCKGTGWKTVHMLTCDSFRSGFCSCFTEQWDCPDCEGNGDRD